MLFAKVAKKLATKEYFLAFPEQVMIAGTGIRDGELVVNEEDPVSLICSPSTASIFYNNVNTIRNDVRSPSVQRDQGGYYQCLSNAMAMTGSVDSAYLVVACKLMYTTLIKDPLRREHNTISFYERTSF